jgi:tetratricopeptide (TPR) repeat protein
MERLTGLLDRVTAGVQPILGWLEPLYPYWQHIAAGLGLVVLLWVLRRIWRRKRPAGSLEAAYEKLGAAGFQERDRPCRILGARPGWKRLPMAFLWELSARLRDKECFIGFVTLAERHGLERKELPAIAKKFGTEAAVRAVALRLAELAKQRPAQAETALSLAVRLDPDDPRLVLDLAAKHYTAERYKDAMPLFEQGIALCRQVLLAPLPTLATAGDGSPDALRAQLAVEQRRKKAEQLLQSSTEQYEVCLDRVDPYLV